MSGARPLIPNRRYSLAAWSHLGRHLGMTTEHKEVVVSVEGMTDAELEAELAKVRAELAAIEVIISPLAKWGAIGYTDPTFRTNASQFVEEGSVRHAARQRWRR